MNCRFEMAFAFFVISLLSIIVQAHELRTVTAAYTFYAPPGMSVEQANQTAFDRAVAQALADEFGMAVTQSTAMVISENNGSSQSGFVSIGGSEVRGEWLRTIGDPKFDISYRDELLVVKISIKGQVREITGNRPTFNIVTMRNGIERKDISTDFHDGDQLFLKFSAPVGGYLAIYLLNAVNGTATRMLPYVALPNAPMAIESGRDYTFFSPHDAHGIPPVVVDEIEMCCSVPTELNDICVLFAPDKFALPISAEDADATTCSIPIKTFYQWTASERIRNPMLQQKTIHISITNTEPCNQLWQ